MAPVKFVPVRATCSPPAVTPKEGKTLVTVGTGELTAKLLVTVGAAANDALPAWSALMLQVPVVKNVKAPPVVMVQTLVVVEVNATPRADEAVAGSVGVLPKTCAAGCAKVMVCGAPVLVRLKLTLLLPDLETKTL